MLPTRAVTILALLGVCCEASAQDDVPLLSSEVRAELEREGYADVIVTLREPAMPYDLPRERRVREIDALRAQVLSVVGAGFARYRSYRHTAAFAGRIDRVQANRLLSHVSVLSVQLDHRGRGQLMEAVPVVQADQVHRVLGLTGRGVRVAVLDSGVDLEHPDLRDAVVAQHCFTRGACEPLGLNEGSSAQDDNGHGTSVTGAIASRGSVAAPGFAPEVEIVALRVLDEDASGSESDWTAALDWIYDNQETLQVDIVNLSFVTEALFDEGECDRRAPAFKRAVDNLVNAGVTVFGATGNGGSSTQLAVPACTTGVIAVGASYDANEGPTPPNGATYDELFGPSFASCNDGDTGVQHIACFTNSNAQMDLVAPGVPITSDWLGGVTAKRAGTSYASAAAAGVAALVAQCRKGLAPTQLRQVLVDTGVPLRDPRNTLMFPLVQAMEAVRAACPELVPAEEEPKPEMDAAVAAEPPGSDRDGASAKHGGADMTSLDAGAPATGQDAGRAMEVSDGGASSGVGTITSAQVGSDSRDAGRESDAIELPEYERKRGSLAPVRETGGCASVRPGARGDTLGWCLLAVAWLWHRRRPKLSCSRAS